MTLSIMTFEQILIYAIDKFSQPGASSSGLLSGLLLISSAALLLKKYVINGNLKKYFDLKEKEVSSSAAVCTHLEALSSKIDTVIDEQKKLLEAAKHERTNYEF